MDYILVVKNLRGMRMTGKEALEQYKKIYVDKVIKGDVPTEDWLLKKINEDLEELERWRKGEFILIPARKMGKTPYYVLAAKVLDKYKRAFEILKDYSIIPPLEDFRYSEYTNCYFAEIEEYDHDYEDYRTIHYVLEKDEYELLEELFKGLEN